MSKSRSERMLALAEIGEFEGMQALAMKWKWTRPKVITHAHGQGTFCELSCPNRKGGPLLKASVISLEDEGLFEMGIKLTDSENWETWKFRHVSDALRSRAAAMLLHFSGVDFSTIVELVDRGDCT